MFSGPASAPRRALQCVLQFFSHAQRVVLQSEASPRDDVYDDLATLRFVRPPLSYRDDCATTYCAILSVAEGTVSAKAMHNSQKLSGLRYLKKSFKAVAKGTALASVLALPTSPSELAAAYPEFYHAVLKSSSPAACPQGMPALIELCDGMAMRSKRRALFLLGGQSDMSTGSFAQPARACMEQMQQMQAQRAFSPFIRCAWLLCCHSEAAEAPPLALNFGAPTLGNATRFQPTSAMDIAPLALAPKAGPCGNDETPLPDKL